MSYKAYVCNLWKKLQIGPKIKFENGFFETDDPLLQAEIEAHNNFGTAIHFRDSEEEMARMGRERQEKRAAERQKQIKQLLAEEDAANKANAEADAKAKAQLAEQKKTEASEGRLRGAARRAAEKEKGDG